jgi:hypothetical protein
MGAKKCLHSQADRMYAGPITSISGPRSRQPSGFFVPAKRHNTRQFQRRDDRSECNTLAGNKTSRLIAVIESRHPHMVAPIKLLGGHHAQVHFAATVAQQSNSRQLTLAGTGSLRPVGKPRLCLFNAINAGIVAPSRIRSEANRRKVGTASRMIF